MRTSYCPGPICDDAGLVEQRVLGDLGRVDPAAIAQTLMPAPKAVTASATSMPTGSAMLGRIHASS